MANIRRLPARVIDVVPPIGKTVAWSAPATMAIVIPLQDFIRYSLDNTLPWPDEAARIFMLAILPLSVVAVVAVGYGGNHTMGFGGNFESSSPRIPFDWIGLDPVKRSSRRRLGFPILTLSHTPTGESGRD